MLSAREVGIVAQRELSRNLRSTKGIAMFSLFLLGGLVFSMLVSNIIGWVLGKLAKNVGMTSIPADMQQQLFEQGFGDWYGSEAVGKYLATAPPILYFLFEGTLVFLPLLVLLVGFDQVAGEIQHRTIRYSAGRASRASIVVGKALGIWGVISVMVLILHATVWVMVLARGGGSIVQIISWGGRFWLFSSVCAAAYVGFSSIVSALFRTPVVALFAGSGVGFMLWLAYTVLGISQRTVAATWAFPNAYEKLLVQPSVLPVLGGAMLFILWGAVCTAGATGIVMRRDV